MELFTLFGVLLCGQVLSTTLSGNGTSGGFTIQENLSLQLTCSSTNDVHYGSFFRRYTDKSPNIITAVGYGPSGCGTDPTPPSYLSCSCVSKREYACVIRNVTRDMNGDVWFCIPPGGNKIDFSGDQTIIVTIGITAVSMEPAFSPVYVIQNTNRQFRCITSDGNPKATIEWYKNNGTEDRADDTKITSGMKTDSIASGTFVRTSGTLNLTVQKNDQEVGVYCKANNGGDWLYSSSVVLDVQYEPSTPKVYYKGFEVTSHVRVISGRSTTLNCNGTGNPSPSYTWTYPGVGPQNGSTLTLASVQTTHAGGVTCTARNTLLPTGGTAVVKTKKTTITLQVLYPSSAPSCTISGTSILTTAILVEGTDNTFSCISSANPPSNTYTWSTPGREQVSGANLTLINVQHTADQGQYTLTATNTMDPTRGNTETGTSNTSFSVNIQYETSIPKLYYQDSVVNFPIRVISKRSVTITCSSTGNPNPTYTWTYPGGGRHSGPTLTLARVQTTHTGDVTCTAKNNLSPTGGTTVEKTRQSTASLQILYSPSRPLCTINTTTISTNAVILEGTDCIISCTSEAFPTPITYSWSTPGRGLVYEKKLFLKNVTHTSDNGQYTLTVNNTMDPTVGNAETGTNTTAFSVAIQFGPKVDLPETYDILMDSVLNYSCSFIPGEPSQTSLYWTRSGDNRTWHSQFASISSVQKSDAGLYTCTAMNRMMPTGYPTRNGSHTGTMRLNVQYESLVSDFHFTEHTGTVNVTKSEYSNATLTCTVDSNPPSTINIRKDDKMKKSVYNSIHMVYTIANLTCWDAGRYTCDGSNKFNNDTPSEKDLLLFVTCTPRRSPDLDIKLNFTAKLHGKATLQYTVFAYPVPSPSQFVWKRCIRSENCSYLANLSGKTDVTTKGLSSNLTILDIDINDFGVYSISVDNGIGKELVEEMYLQPGGPPDSPTAFDVIEESIGETQATLTWKHGFNNGFRQTFHLSSRTLNEFVTVLDVNVSDNELAENINYTLNQLRPGKKYYVELFASNAEGISMSVNATFTTLVRIVINPEGPSAAVVGGSIGGSICAVLAIGGVIFGVMKFRNVGNKKDEEILPSKQHTDELQVDEDDELPDIVENSMYVPAGHISRKVNNSDADALYAQPNKCKASGSKGAELYAEVNKVAKKKAAGKKRKKTTYENKAYESSTYENHELQETKKQVNKDGLIYADLAFPKQPKGRKPFIHGLDDMTVYADVDLSRKAEPLPDSDDEGSGEKNKK